MTYKELTERLNALTDEQQNQTVTVAVYMPTWEGPNNRNDFRCSSIEMWPLRDALNWVGDDRLDGVPLPDLDFDFAGEGHFVLEI